MNTQENFTLTAIPLLDKFVSQRSGLEFCIYGDVSAFRAEQRSITRDLHHYRALRNAVAWRTFTREEWDNAFRAFSGRLTLAQDGDTFALDYCVGQYFPTEYRRAACAVLASLLWESARGDVPKGTESAGITCAQNFGVNSGAQSLIAG
jgi:hypothetical protein